LNKPVGFVPKIPEDLAALTDRDGNLMTEFTGKTKKAKIIKYRFTMAE